MLIYQKYIIKSILLSFILALVVLTGMVWLSQVLRLAYLFERKTLFLEFLTITFLIIPALLHSITPFGLLFAFIYSYNNLKINKEIVALKAAGISIKNLLYPFFAVGLLVCVCALLNSSILMPYSYNLLKEKIHIHKNSFASAAIDEGIFAQLSKKLVLFLNKKVNSERFTGIILFDYRGNGPPSILFSEEGRMMNRGGMIKFYLLNGLRQSFSKMGNIEILSFDELNVKLSSDVDESMPIKEKDVMGRYIWELLPLKDGAISKNLKFTSEAHNRINWSLMSLVLPLVTIAILLRAEYRRSESVYFTFKALCCGMFFVIMHFVIFSLQSQYFWALPYLNICSGLIMISFLATDKQLNSRIPI